MPGKVVRVSNVCWCSCMVMFSSWLHHTYIMNFKRCIVRCIRICIPTLKTKCICLILFRVTHSLSSQQKMNLVANEIHLVYAKRRWTLTIFIYY